MPGRANFDIVMGDAMATVTNSSWLGGGNSNNNSGNNAPPSSNGASNNANPASAGRNEITWTRGGRQFSSSREIYTRSLYRICLKFTTSEDEDEGKPEPATAYWTLYGNPTTIGNGVPNSQRPDDICRRMDDSMSGPAAGILSCLVDEEGEQAAMFALKAGMTCGWQIRGERGDVAVRVGRAKVFSKQQGSGGGGEDKDARLLTLDAERWVLGEGASFAAGNSVFTVEKNGSYMRLTGPYAHKGVGALTIGDEFIVGRTGFSVNRFDCGISEAIGARPFTTFAAVFDGHGGDECSNYLVDALPRHIHSGEDATSELMRRILKTAYLRADKEFITPKNAPQSGSTGATVVLLGRRLFAANVGDSRVVLARKNGACLELTSDHKPSRPDEAARVRAAGGFILHKRVMGELAITRAFGDKSFKMGIKAIPRIACTTSHHSLRSLFPQVLSHDDEFLLLACDGLFDVFKSQDAITFARQELIAHRGEPAEVARILSDQAIRVRRSRDNVSILIIVLRPFWEDVN
ncbi:hypothetical protein THAPSDRAFT_262261 [Thalassiosira pseudonana CCMP1335]